MQVQFLTWQLSVERVTPTAEELVEKYNAIVDKWVTDRFRFRLSPVQRPMMYPIQIRIPFHCA